MKTHIRTGLTRSRRGKPSERGVALIVTILVATILGILGLSLLTMTETEERVATTYRDEAQLQEVAKAGVRVAQQMFRQPTGQLVPQYTAGTPASGSFTYNTEAHLNAMGIYRSSRGARGTYSGASNTFFKGPFADSWQQVFGGTRSPSDLPDLRYDCDGIASANCFLDQRINSSLTNITNPAWNNNVGKITEIRFYEPPIYNGRLYGYATVVVEATKFNGRGQPVAVQRAEAILGSNASQPAIMADGNIDIQSSSHLCGNGCETIHANGNITMGSSSTASGGGAVTLSATGTINLNGSTVTPPKKEGADNIEPPTINPWDTTYKPASAALDRYYLMTTRTLDIAWTDNNTGNNPAPVPCGNSTCQDYQLDYDTSGTAQTDRGTGSGAYLYKWNNNTDSNGERWVLVDSTSPLTIGGASFEVYNSTDNTVSGTDDNSGVVPFNKTRVPKAYFKMASSYQPNNTTDAGQGVTLLVDGCFWASSSFGQDPVNTSNPAWNASVIAVGSIYLGSSGYMQPALPNRVMLIAGRDIFIESSMNNNTIAGACTLPNTGTNAANLAAVIAAHEQVYVQSSSDLNGIIIAEDEVNFDDNRDTNGFKVPGMTVHFGGSALYLSSSSQHTYRCNFPSWPWPTSGQAKILALTTEPAIVE